MVKDGDGEQYIETICRMLCDAKDARKSDDATHILFMINKQNLVTVLRGLEYMFSSENKVASVQITNFSFVKHSEKYQNLS